MGINTKGGRRRQDRRNRQAEKERAKPQYYGGEDKARAREIERGNEKRLGQGQELEDTGLAQLSQERTQQQRDKDRLTKQVDAERQSYGEDVYKTREMGEEQRGAELGKATQYGAGADQALSGALGSADQLEGYAKNAASEYQSAADAASNAAMNKSQTNALALAAGRGGGSLRTALATSGAANQQTMLDQQAIRAQEANQLAQMRSQAVADAAGIRSGAAQLQAGRQQGATGTALSLLGQRAAQEQANAQYGLGAANQQQSLSAQNTQTGMLEGGAVADAGANRAGMSNQNLGQQYTAQLGGDIQTEAQRAQTAKENSAYNKFQRGVSIGTLGLAGGSGRS
jgi:hypothetical protein